MKRMTWTEITKAYPDKWVAIANPVMDGSDILEGDVVTVLSDDEVDAYEINNHGKGYKHRRTNIRPSPR